MDDPTTHETNSTSAIFCPVFQISKVPVCSNGPSQIRFGSLQRFHLLLHAGLEEMGRLRVWLCILVLAPLPRGNWGNNPVGMSGNLSMAHLSP